MPGGANSAGRSKESIVEQILEQGQRLRNAMVKAILDADPLYVDETISKSKKDGTETIAVKYHMQSRCDTCNKQKGPAQSGICNNGNNHNQSQCQFNSSYFNRLINKPPHHDVFAPVADEYDVHNSSPDDITRSIQDSYRSKSTFYFKYVNSLKIALYSLILNQPGNRKVNSTLLDARYKLPISMCHNYFVEYSIPVALLNEHVRSGQSKIDSGLNASAFRICSKKLEDEEIHLKHTSIHDVKNLLHLDLKGIEVVFQVSCRTMKQKNTNIIGYGKFCMSSFEVTKNLTCNQDIPILDNEAISFGIIKLSLQLGCGRMYFGKEFVDFIDSNISNVESLHFNTPIETERSAHEDRLVKSTNLAHQNKVKLSVSSSNKNVSPIRSPPVANVPFTCESSNVNKLGENVKKSCEIVYKHINDPLSSATNNNHKEILLFGFVYISEAQYFTDVCDSYLSCQVFCQGDTLCSRIVINNKQPVFNFYQKIPFLLDEVLLSCLRDNSLIVEFWDRHEDEDVVFGTAQLSLHQFYTSYNNPAIVNNIIYNKLPVTISDWWEPISHITEGNLCGQVKILIALGSAAQIENLETERGFKELNYRVKYIPVVPDKAQGLFRRPNSLKSNNKTLKINKVNDKKKIDIGIQSDLDNMETHYKDSLSVQNMLETFLSELKVQKPKNIHVESGTNTETAVEKHEANTAQSFATESLNKLSECRNATDMHLKKTSDLLDYLNDALSGDSRLCSNQPANTTVSSDLKSFRAHVVIDSALHLPTKRNHKSRKTKKKCSESPPSPYVTFETCSRDDVVITPVISRSCSPQWKFSCDVLLPTELLNNNQKRLIFKVWSKNANSPHPNLQTDIVLGFAALDLTVLVSGLPSVQGWFNIIDFTSKCNGQIKIDVTPLESIKHVNSIPQVPVMAADSLCESESKELLSRALKRKFTQLDEITQRLRARLADVTKDDSDLTNDAFADEFENDINTAGFEDDLNMIDLSSSDGKSHSSNSSATVLEIISKSSSNHFVSTADQELIRGKQRIDTLLEKLTLLSNNEVDTSFSNRYVSGCSLQQNSEEMFVKPIEVCPTTFNQLNLTQIDSIPSLTQLSDVSVKTSGKTNDSIASSSSLSARLPAVYRYAPEGAGNTIDDDDNS